MKRIAAVLLIAGFAAAQVSEPLVRQVDHIIIGVDEPQKLFLLLSEKLAIPVAWPFQSYGNFSSGGVGLGNANIEIIRRPAGLPAGFVSVALDPGSLANVIPRLDALGLHHGPPQPFRQKEELLWTIMELPDVPPAGHLFYCQYHFDIAENRATSKRELEKRFGGPLGIDSALELVIGLKNEPSEWQKLLGDRPLTGGPAIRFAKDREDRFQILRIRIKSLAVARAFLKREGLLGLDSGKEISFDRSAVGADIRLVE